MVSSKAHLDILNRSGVTHECQMNGRTDIVVANAALNYVARSKSYWYLQLLST